MRTKATFANASALWVHALASGSRPAYRHSMRLKSSIWVAAYLRRCQTEGVLGAVQARRGGGGRANCVNILTHSRQTNPIDPEGP
jgi:hypothetical protein